MRAAFVAAWYNLPCCRWGGDPTTGWYGSCRAVFAAAVEAPISAPLPVINLTSRYETCPSREVETTVGLAGLRCAILDEFPLKTWFRVPLWTPLLSTNRLLYGFAGVNPQHIVRVGCQSLQYVRVHENVIFVVGEKVRDPIRRDIGSFARVIRPFWRDCERCEYSKHLRFVEHWRTVTGHVMLVWYQAQSSWVIRSRRTPSTGERS